MLLMKPIYLLATIAMMTEKVSFFISTATIAKEANFFDTMTEFLNPHYPSKNGVKEIKSTQEKLLLRCDFYHIPNNPDNGNRVKTQQKFFFLDINCHLSYT